jgi:hypothetical protein
MDNAIKIIEVIGSQWPFLLVMFFIIVVIARRKPIGIFISELTQFKIKKGDTEFEFNKVKEEINEQAKGIESLNEDAYKPNNKDINIDEQDDLFKKHFSALRDKNFKEAKELFEKILDKETDEQLRKKRKVGNFHWRHMHGDSSAFDELEEYITNIVNDDELKSYAFYNLNFFYEDSSSPDKAIELLKDAISLSSNENHITNCVSRISFIENKNENYLKAEEILFEYLLKITDRKALSNLYTAIARHYNKTGNKLLESIAYQKSLEGMPNSTDLLFSAAYNYSEVSDKFHDMGLFLYKKLLGVNPTHQNGLNNIGVSCTHLGLPIKSISYYKKSFENNNTLAASNLANTLIKSGFKEEAETYVNKAQELEDIHDNVYSSASHIKSQVKSELDSEEKIVKKAEKKYRFFKKYGEAAFTNVIVKLSTSNSWKINDIEANVKIDKNKIQISWESGEEKHDINGIINKNSLDLSYSKPKRNIYSFKADDKYTYSNYSGYGYIDSEKLIICVFEVDNELIELKITE